MNSKQILLASVCIISLLVGIGCDTTKAKSAELARVAKDWSLTIRASQVIPVYPLTEDILPGDVFVVQTRIEDQVKQYEDKGFLPLDQLLARLQPTNYPAFYLNSYGIGSLTNTPYHWKFPNDPKLTNELANAPRAGFPTYTFDVKRGAGVNVAVPVNGIPIALNYMATGSAHGEITISDAYTFGIDQVSLRNQVVTWGKSHSDTLIELAPTASRTNFLRVVSRVFWTGRVNVSLRSDRASGGAISGGAAREVNLFDPGNAEASTNYSTIIQNVNKMLENS